MLWCVFGTSTACSNAPVPRLFCHISKPQLYGPRKAALTSGVVPRGAARASAALTDEAQPPAPSVPSLVFHCPDEGFGGEGDSQQGQAPQPQPAGASDSDVAPIVLFRVVHKDLSSLKRPLAAVDNLRSGDLAIKVYAASDMSCKEGRSTLLVNQSSRSSEGVSLFRLLDSSRAASQQQLISNLQSWQRETHEPVRVKVQGGSLGPEATQLLTDMMSCRAFVGTGRAYQVHGPDRDWPGLSCLHELGLAEKLPDSGSSSRQKAKIRARGQRHDSKPSNSDVIDLEEDDWTLQGDWCLTSRAVATFNSPLRLGNPSQVFSARSDVALQDRTTFEIYLQVTALGFKELTDRAAIQRASQRPYTAKRGREPGRGVLAEDWKHRCQRLESSSPEASRCVA